MRTVIENAAIATVDAAGTEHAGGHVVVDGEVIESVGAGPAPAGDYDRRFDGTGCLVTPGFVNTHHHLYQWATRGFAQQSTLFEWLVELYPIWAGIDEKITHGAALAGLVRLAKTGCTTAADHHYVFPRGEGDLIAPLVDAAGQVGIRLHAVRGSMDRGESRGGLPPDSVVEDKDEALAATAAAIDRYHDPAPGSFVRVAVGPCSPFTVSTELMTEAAELARARGVRLHTHLAETVDEEEQCLAELGCTPMEYAERTGWLGEDVWLAHGIHFADGGGRPAGRHRHRRRALPDVERAGWVRAPRGSPTCSRPARRSGSASTVPRPTRTVGWGSSCARRPTLARLRGGPAALSARDALRLATMGGARCLGRQDEIGSLEPGKQADLAVWRLDGVEHAGIADPVAALVFGALPPLALLLAGGDPVVEDGACVGVSEVDAATGLRAASAALLAKVAR